MKEKKCGTPAEMQYASDKSILSVDQVISLLGHIVLFQSSLSTGSCWELQNFQEIKRTLWMSIGNQENDYKGSKWNTCGNVKGDGTLNVEKWPINGLRVWKSY